MPVTILLVTDFPECSFFENITPSRPLKRENGIHFCNWSFGDQDFVLTAFDNPEDCYKTLREWKGEYDGIIKWGDFEMDNFSILHPEVPIIDIDTLPPYQDVRNILTDLYRVKLFNF